MGQLRVSQVRRKVKNHLDRERYEHTLGVMYTAGAMAMCHGADLEQAMLTGLLHDCAKCISDDKKIKMCDKYHLNVSAVEAETPALLHAKLGAFLTVKKYHIHDKEIVNAIASHTTGRPEMTTLDKIIYIADYIEPGRYEAPNLEEVRKLAFSNMNECLYQILGDTFEYLQNKGVVLDPMAEKTYLYYKHKLNK